MLIITKPPSSWLWLARDIIDNGELNEDVGGAGDNVAAADAAADDDDEVKSRSATAVNTSKLVVAFKDSIATTRMTTKTTAMMMMTMIITCCCCCCHLWWCLCYRKIKTHNLIDGCLFHLPCFSKCPTFIKAFNSWQLHTLYLTVQNDRWKTNPRFEEQFVFVVWYMLF